MKLRIKTKTGNIRNVWDISPNELRFYKPIGNNIFQKDMEERGEYSKQLRKRDRHRYYIKNREKELRQGKERKRRIKENPILWEKERERIKQYRKKYRKRNHELYLIRQQAYSNLRDNIIKERKVCELCGSDKNLELHHIAYINNKENIQLLCRKCHRNLHRKE